MSPLIPEPDDDPQFIARVDSLLGGAIEVVGPAQIYVVKLDHWFDHKWLDFAYKAVGALGVWHHCDPTLPPFHPHRVVWQRHYSRRREGGRYRLDGEGERLHVLQNSRSNFWRRVSSHPFRASVLAWFSGYTAKTGEGSLMVYYNTPSDYPHGVCTSSWYASFSAGSGWGVRRYKGISRRELSAFDERCRARVRVTP